MPKPMGWLITFMAVNIAWVFFRAEDFQTAFAILSAMAGITNGEGLTAIFKIKQLFCFIGLIGLCAVIPNVKIVMDKYFKPNYKWFGLLAIVFFYTLSRCTQASEFLYFQF